MSDQIDAFPHDVSDFILRTTDGSDTLIQPAVLAVVELLPHRIADGFHPALTVAVYPRLKPSSLMCFNWRGNHMHLLSRCESAEDVLITIQNLIQNPQTSSSTIEQMLKWTFDPMSVPERMMNLRVATAEDISKAS